LAANDALNAQEGMLALMHTNTLDRQTPPDADPTSYARIVIVADDLTGACDSGVAFLASGRTVRVMLHGPGCNANVGFPASNDGEPDVISFTTETRNLTEKEASERVAEAMATLAGAQRPVIVFKKVDSAARGNLGAETVATLEASGVALALVAPAFPQTERTVHSGILSVHDCSGQDSRISLRDQFSLVDSNHIGVLNAGPAPNLLGEIRHAIDSGMRILLCDAETQEDLERLSVAALQLQEPILWAGSAGLARALAATLPGLERRPTPQTTRLRGRTLLFAGKPHPVTQLQLSCLEEHPRRPEHAVVRVDCGPAPKQEIRDAFAAEPVAALILTGGDTAALVLQSLHASSILLGGELSPGIPWGFVEGGAADGCLVVTKSGGFGERDALVRAFEFCDRRSNERA
jgi:uncharacterized protein YgbK (DUF1537 family)